MTIDRIQGKRHQKELEAAFMEDYNTCTMPSAKYYDLQAWEKNERLRNSAMLTDKAKTKGQLQIMGQDEKQKQEDLQRQKEAAEKRKLEAAVQEFRNFNQDQMQDMKHQERLVEQMKLLNRAGNYAEAAKIKARLDPSRKNYNI
eukprot:g5660.t1